MRTKIFVATFFCLQICGFHGLVIHPCNNNTAAGFEESQATFTCKDIPSDATVRWGLADENTLYVEIGSCEADGLCRVNHENQMYNFSRSARAMESQMTVWKLQRNFGNRTVVCKVSDTKTSCNFIVQSQPVLEGCSFNITSRAVTSQCFVTQAYSSNNQYRCIWKRNNVQQNVSIPEDIQACGKDGREFVCWTCHFTQAIPATEGVYTYTISTEPPAVQQYSHSFTAAATHTTGALSEGVIAAAIISPAVKIAIVVIAVIVIRMRRSTRRAIDLSDEGETGITVQRPSITARLKRLSVQSRQQRSSSLGNGPGHT
ncbi:uncharacterized protein LOC112556567 isoform X2 [Pomacea canaliculata]|uniref:uncharacterized protein LOC112556567 isoform X2 n=1 Tax=Pomacea canaliculata TaxID=400727 RepID=UPI000D736A1E|nr:uncharacterized protein LOC112556567 isoform X2 [Pomacea canaliculata]XP_025081493.1 uncharacterized protein LOC112556567 isoform X2 [Pomacea canaliculata]